MPVVWAGRRGGARLWVARRKPLNTTWETGREHGIAPASASVNLECWYLCAGPWAQLLVLVSCSVGVLKPGSSPVHMLASLGRAQRGDGAGPPQPPCLAIITSRGNELLGIPRSSYSGAGF